MVWCELEKHMIGKEIKAPREWAFFSALFFSFQQGLIVFCFLMGSFSTLKSQTVQERHPWWVNLGAGPALIGTNFAMDAGMVYCYQFENSLLSARILGITNYNPTVQRIDHSSTIYKMTDYGVLYGPIWRFGKSYVSIAAGIGLVRAAKETSASGSTNSSISLPLETQWFWRPTDFVGVGIYFYTSVNFEKSFIGALFCAQLGMWN
jgi:hypothetical protein